MTDCNPDSSRRHGLPEWPCACGTPEAGGTLRAVAEDFRVDEELGFAPDGAGGHALLRVLKRETNTEWLARELARFAGVKPVDVGFAGLKDRHAVTTQWYSVHLGREPEPDWSAFNSAQVEVLEVTRHRRKLLRGELKGNRFVITLRGLTGDLSTLGARLERVRTYGVPNYFGEQRFGIDGGNLTRADDLFAGRLHEPDRHRRGLYISAARSFLFNRVLAQRVEDGSWNRALPGEAVMLAGGNSVFDIDEVSAAIERRVAAGELLPTGPLWGRGPLPSSGTARVLEQAAVASCGAWCSALEQLGLQQERRALCLRVQELKWELDMDEAYLTMAFQLPAGAYATTVVREVSATHSAAMAGEES